MYNQISQQLSPDQIGKLYGAWATPLPPDRKSRYNGAPEQDFAACRVAATVASLATDMGWLAPLITVDACSDEELNEASIENAETGEPSQ